MFAFACSFLSLHWPNTDSRTKQTAKLFLGGSVTNMVISIPPVVDMIIGNARKLNEADETKQKNPGSIRSKVSAQQNGKRSIFFLGAQSSIDFLINGDCRFCMLVLGSISVLSTFI